MMRKDNNPYSQTPQIHTEKNGDIIFNFTKMLHPNQCLKKTKVSLSFIIMLISQVTNFSCARVQTNRIPVLVLSANHDGFACTHFDVILIRSGGISPRLDFPRFQICPHFVMLGFPSMSDCQLPHQMSTAVSCTPRKLLGLTLFPGVGLDYTVTHPKFFLGIKACIFNLMHYLLTSRSGRT